MPNPDYKKMFEDLEPYHPDPDDLFQLARIITGQNDATVTEKNTPRRIPAGYTYLAQFIAHDISFDELSDRFIKSDLPWEILDSSLIKDLRNLRRPNFDLETIYGYENPTNRGEISRRDLLRNGDLPLLKLGRTEKTAVDGNPPLISYPHDLPRSFSCAKARIVDPRNDENLLLAQTQLLFMKFHNAIVVHLSKSEKYVDDSGKNKYKKDELFRDARKLTIRHYQMIILKDFLPRVVQEKVLENVLGQFKPAKLFYQPDMFMPLEFAVAAFRFGHSMIRGTYNLNKRRFENDPPQQGDDPATLRQLGLFTGRGEMESSEFRTLVRLPSDWIINWNMFYETGNPLINLAELIDTNLRIELARLRPVAVDDPNGRANFLTALDLFRGRRYGLPKGQDVAEKMGETALTPDEIKSLIMSKETSVMGSDELKKVKERLCEVFCEKTPLWFYILAEAELRGDGKLGNVGSRIVCETIIHLLYYSEYSILQNEREEQDELLQNKNFFTMPDLLGFVNKMGHEHFANLYPNSPDEFDDINPLGNN